MPIITSSITKRQKRLKWCRTTSIKVLFVIKLLLYNSWHNIDVFAVHYYSNFQSFNIITYELNWLAHVELTEDEKCRASRSNWFKVSWQGPQHLIKLKWSWTSFLRLSCNLRSKTDKEVTSNLPITSKIIYSYIYFKTQLKYL